MEERRLRCPCRLAPECWTATRHARETQNQPVRSQRRPTATSPRNAPQPVASRHHADGSRLWRSASMIALSLMEAPRATRSSMMSDVARVDCFSVRHFARSCACLQRSFYGVHSRAIGVANLCLQLEHVALYDARRVELLSPRGS